MRIRQEEIQEFNSYFSMTETVPGLAFDHTGKIPMRNFLAGLGSRGEASDLLVYWLRLRENTDERRRLLHCNSERTQPQSATSEHFQELRVGNLIASARTFSTF